MGKFGFFGLQKFASGRGVVKQVLHDHGSTLRMWVGLQIEVLFPAICFDAPGAFRLGGPGNQRQPGNGTDAGQRFPAKTHALDLVQIIQCGNFAGGMPGQCQCDVFPVYAAAIVADAHQSDAALLDVDVDLTGPGIEAVFQQFLDHRSWPLHHLTGSDLIDQLGRQGMDAHDIRSAKRLF